MNIDAIRNGIVIDHITAGKAMQVYNMLNLDKLDCQVAIIRNTRPHAAQPKEGAYGRRNRQPYKPAQGMPLRCALSACDRPLPRGTAQGLPRGCTASGKLLPIRQISIK